jgi:hypothetical protein
LNIAATETVPLFEYLSYEFLRDYDVFAPLTSERNIRSTMRWLSSMVLRGYRRPAIATGSASNTSHMGIGMLSNIYFEKQNAEPHYLPIVSATSIQQPQKHGCNLSLYGGIRLTKHDGTR